MSDTSAAAAGRWLEDLVLDHRDAIPGRVGAREWGSPSLERTHSSGGIHITALGPLAAHVAGHDRALA